MSVNVTVKVEDGNFDKAFSIFKREVSKHRILDEVKKRSEYVKPSEKKHRERKRIKRRYEQQATESKLSGKSFTQKS